MSVLAEFIKVKGNLVSNVKFLLAGQKQVIASFRSRS